MQKKMILVGLSNRSLGWEFFKAVLDSLERYSVTVAHADCVRLRFETEHTKTWFFFKGDRYDYFQGIRPDAVFGSQWKMLQYYTSSNTFIGPEEGVGLVEYICKVEKEAVSPWRAYPVKGYGGSVKRYVRDDDMDVPSMYPGPLFTKQALNSIYGTSQFKTKRLDPEVFKTVEIKPLANDKTPDGLRVDFPAIDEWDSYKNGVTSGLWPKTNPYLMPKEDVERIFQEGSKQFVDQQLIYALGRGNGKSWACLKEFEKEYEKKEGEKLMNTAVNDLIMNKRAYLVTDNGRVPVLIETLSMACGEAPSFEGHILEPTLNDIINRRVDYFKSKPSKLPGIKTVHFSGPVTAVIWADGTKSLVRCNNENVDYEKGLAMAIAKKALGTNMSGSNYYDIFKKYLPEDKAEPKKKKTAKTEETPKKKKTMKGDKQDG